MSLINFLQMYTKINNIYIDLQKAFANSYKNNVNYDIIKGISNA